jgi:hypothetical protein
MTWTAETAAKRMIADWPTKITEAWIARHLQAAHDADRPAASDGGVEAVARAICKAEEPEFDPGADANGSEPALWTNYISHAQAALAAARVPEMRAMIERLISASSGDPLRWSAARALLASLDAADKEAK